MIVGFGFGFTTPFGWLVYLLWFWFYDSQVKTALFQNCVLLWRLRSFLYTLYLMVEVMYHTPGGCDFYDVLKVWLSFTTYYISLLLLIF